MMKYRIYVMTEKLLRQPTKTCMQTNIHTSHRQEMDKEGASHDVMKIYRIGRKINIKHKKKKSAIKIYYMKFRLQLYCCV